MEQKGENSQGAQRQTGFFWLQTLKTRLLPFYVSKVLIGSFHAGVC